MGKTGVCAYGPYLEWLVEGTDMLRHQPRSAADEAGGRPDDEPPFVSDLDAVHVRNYDHQEGHSIHVTLENVDGRAALTDRSYLAPGQSAHVSGTIDPGRYRLRIRVDGIERRRADVELDRTGAGTAVVELGNGVVSVTEGA